MQAVVFSPQGEYFASGGQDGKVMVWKSNINAAKTMAEKVRNLILNHRILVIFFIYRYILILVISYVLYAATV